MSNSVNFADLANQLGAKGLALSPSFLAGDYTQAVAYAATQVARAKHTVASLTLRAIWVVSGGPSPYEFTDPLAVLDCTLLDALQACGCLQGADNGNRYYAVDQAVSATSLPTPPVCN